VAGRTLTIPEFEAALMKALERRIAAMGGVPEEFTDNKLWLPESHWRVQVQVDELMARAKQLQAEQDRKVQTDKAYAAAPAADFMAEWDAELPTLQGGSAVLESAGWGRRRMAEVLGYDRSSLRPPTPGSHQPEYHFECYQCGRPITIQGKDHGGRTSCDLAMLPNDMIEAGSYWGDHTPKPWHGEEEEDDDE
jgi:hypothetical protein